MTPIKISWQEALRPCLDDMEGLAARSLISCHCKGMDSILFDDTPERRVRIFITSQGHDLWTNDVSQINGFRNDMSVALHPHHCAVRLVPVLGSIVNVQAKVVLAGGYSMPEWRYESPITKGQGRFIATGKTAGFSTKIQRLGVGEYRSLAPKEIHTVYVAQNEVAAWMVVEGSEDHTYENVCYSKAALDKFDFTGMYQRMDRGTLNRHLKTLGFN